MCPQTNTSAAAVLCCVLGLLILPGCRDDLVRSDGDCDDADQDDASMPDLPCGGADLMTDNLNCGACGNECVLMDEDTPYAAGNCVLGECGPLWSDCIPDVPAYINCSDVCEGYGQACVANGCSGYTGILYEVNFDGTNCGPFFGDPATVISGGCDEPIPWTSTGDNPREVLCCCDFQ